jgi:hypothetical protein
MARADKLLKWLRLSSMTLLGDEMCKPADGQATVSKGAIHYEQ